MGRRGGSGQPISAVAASETGRERIAMPCWQLLPKEGLASPSFQEQQGGSPSSLPSSLPSGPCHYQWNHSIGIAGTCSCCCRWPQRVFSSCSFCPSNPFLSLPWVLSWRSESQEATAVASPGRPLRSVGCHGDVTGPAPGAAGFQEGALLCLQRGSPSLPLVFLFL